MIGTCLSHYQITALLGAGGMGEVYRARDTRLGREVAIKMLPTSFEKNAERLSRFEREARLLASLNHPHIASIYDFEQHQGKHFLVLELIEGETLDERLRRGALPMIEALGVCQQIAEALEAAHQKGIIHRDLKPANIKFTPSGKVKVLDFGLAKALRASADPDETTQLGLTLVGSVLGSPAYMSPEQAKGDEVDERSDTWAFGCILYECLTGERLFGGKTITECLSALLQKEVDCTRLPKQTPAAVEQLLRKCLDRDSRRRLRRIENAAADLETAINEVRTGRSVKRSLIGKKLVFNATVATLLVLIAGSVWWFSHKPANKRITSLAVKPLDNLSGPTNETYLSDGMTEALCSALANISALRVPARTTVLRYKGSQMAISEMASELKVDAVLEGSVQRLGDEVPRMTPSIGNIMRH